MALRDEASSIQGLMMRVTCLFADGTIDTGYPVFTTKGFITASFAPQFEDGEEINEKNAAGEVCITWKGADTISRLDFNLSLCSPDPEVTALLAGGQVILACLADVPNNIAVGDVLGYTSPAVGAPVGNPVAIEIWSIANVGGKPATGYPYWHWAFPYCKMRYEGDREFSNGALVNEYSGTAVGNTALIPSGLHPTVDPAGDFVVYRKALANPFSYVRGKTVPTVGWSGTFVPSGTNSMTCEIAFTAVTAGSPGTFTPSTAWPDDITELNAGPDPAPATAWTPGQYVVLSGGSEAYWNGTTFVPGRAPQPSTGATAGIPGLWTPAGSVPPLTVANLIAGTPNVVTASPATVWTTGQYVQTQATGTAGRAHWNGTIWVAGAKP